MRLPAPAPKQTRSPRRPAVEPLEPRQLLTAATVAFTDSFTPAPSSLWNNYTGDWTAANGQYYARAASGGPSAPAVSDLPFHLTDLTMTVAADNMTDGGIALHGNGTNADEVILVLGGNGYGQGYRSSPAGTSAYWVVDNSGVPEDEVDGVFTPGDNYNLTVTVVGDVYSLYVNGGTTPVTTLTDGTLPSGTVGLYDDQPNTANGGSGPPMTFGDFTLTGTSVPAAVAPTLKGALPKSVIAGQKTTVNQTLTLAAPASAAYDGSVTTQYFLDAGTNLDANAIALTTATAKTVAIKAGKSTPARLHLASLPAAVPAGTYHLIAEVTDGNGDASVAASAGTVTVAAPTVSLSGKVTAVSPTSIAAGKTVSFTFTVTNGGNVSSTGAATYAVYLSTDGTSQTIAVTPKAKLPASPTIGPKRSLSVRMTVAVPVADVAMDLYPLVVFTQGGRTITAAATTPVDVG